ncbi:MAG: hypothetical protein Q4G27_01255 [Flavobacteriaceae bacterium]|nr:hypothetical protein [Flavobacteriaceae bacterium]
MKTIIHLHINHLIDKLIITDTGPESVEKLGGAIRESLLRAINSVQESPQSAEDTSEQPSPPNQNRFPDSQE